MYGFAAACLAPQLDVTAACRPIQQTPNGMCFDGVTLQVDALLLVILNPLHPCWTQAVLPDKLRAV
jgi:hypothetical protein